MGFSDKLNEMRNREHYGYPSNKEDTQVNNVESGYTLEELKHSLLDLEGLENIVSNYKVIGTEVNYDTLMIATVTPDLEEKFGTPAGHYIGLSKERITENEYLYNKHKNSAPISILERARVIEPLFRIKSDDYTYDQYQLVEDIKNNVKVEDVSDEVIEKGYILTSSEEVTQLEIVSKKDIELKIDDCLVRYKDLANPDSYLKHYLKLKDMLDDSESMVYCPLVDRCVFIMNSI